MWAPGSDPGILKGGVQRQFSSKWGGSNHLLGAISISPVQRGPPGPLPLPPLDLPLGAVYPMRLVEVLVLSSERVCVLFACLRTVLGRITACTLLLAPLLPHVNTVANYIIMSIEPSMCSLILAATQQPLTFQRAVASSWAH